MAGQNQASRDSGWAVRLVDIDATARDPTKSSTPEEGGSVATVSGGQEETKEVTPGQTRQKACCVAYSSPHNAVSTSMTAKRISTPCTIHYVTSFWKRLYIFVQMLILKI